MLKSDKEAKALDLFADPDQLIPGSVEANNSITRAFYMSGVIATVQASLSLAATIAMLRLLLFHIRLGKKK